MPGRHLGDDFSRTVKALFDALPVSQIASAPIACCRPTDIVSGVFAKPEWLGFDTIGVKEDDKVVGFVHRDSSNRKEEAEALMEKIPPGLVLAPKTPLPAAIRLLTKHEAIFIGNGGRPKGIVTRSDLLRMPVRLLCFAFVAHLELVLAETIARTCGEIESSWLHLLFSKRQKMFEKRREELKKGKMDPSPIEILELCDKRTIVAKTLKFKGGAFEKDVGSIERHLRNPVAHASDFLGGSKDVSRLLTNLQAAFHWGQVLRKKYRISTGGFTELEEVGKALFGDGWEQERESWDEAIPEHTEVDA